MSKRTNLNSGKRKYRRRKKSKSEKVAGAFVIEGLGIIAFIVLFAFAKQATQPENVKFAEAPQPGMNQPIQQSELDWRAPDIDRSQSVWNQVR